MSDVLSSVRVLSECRVAPASSSDHAGQVTEVKLSFMDALWLATPPVQQVFLYELAGDDEFTAVVKRLKESLAAVLALYLPLAGKLAYRADAGEVVVDCSDAGVAFFEAEASDSALLVSLLPKHDACVLPAPVMALQATRLGAAGLGLGMSVHHAVADGRAMGLFKDAWASVSRGGPAAIRSLALPVHDREAIVHPGGNVLARKVVHKVAPHLPVANNTKDYVTQSTRLGRATFCFGMSDIRALKQHINALAASADASGEATRPVSTFVALAALGWTAFVRARGLAAGDDAYLTFQVDLRARLGHRVPDGYFGNCVRGCLAVADAGELLGEAALLRASRAIQVAVTEVVAAPVAGTEAWMERVGSLARARPVAYVAGSPLFRVHEAADFGFGMPSLVAPVSMPGSPVFPSSNCDPADSGLAGIVLLAGTGHGQVLMSVSADPPVLVDAFKTHINLQSRSRM